MLFDLKEFKECFFMGLAEFFEDLLGVFKERLRLEEILETNFDFLGQP